MEFHSINVQFSSFFLLSFLSFLSHFELILANSTGFSCETNDCMIDYADPTTPNHHKNKKLVSLLLGLSTGATTATILSIILSVFIRIFLLINGKPRRNSKVTIFTNPIIKKPEDLAFLEDQNAMENLQLIGKGGCGEVYKAELPSNNEKKIALKKIRQPSNEIIDLNDEQVTKMLNKKMRQIRAEVQTIGKIQHRNLLALLAHVSLHNCHYLVYEYMKNGSLHDIMSQVAEKKREFDWLSRYKVALGVAAGLEYLHMNTNPRIIHRDLKPANILLDDQMEPKIADFGLAMRISIEESHLSTSKVAGTVGYIAPDYYQTMKLTEKSDIFSFGVILGGLTMGKLPGDKFFQNTKEMNLVLWMRNMMNSEHPERALDPKLIGNGYEMQMLQALKIACLCTFDDPKQRPNSKDVRYMLLRIGAISDVLLHLHPNI